MEHDFVYISNDSRDVWVTYQQVQNLIRDWQVQCKDFTFRCDVVGSYKRNMITCDRKSNVGYDFDFNIEANTNLSPKLIKQTLIAALNKVVNKYGYDYAEDSTRVITIKKKDTKNSRIIHSVDFAIVSNRKDEKGNACQYYIRFVKKNNTYQWCKQKDGYYRLPERMDWIKEVNLWDELRALYLKMKNENRDKNLHSRTILVKAVNQVCQQNGYFEENGK